MDNVSVGVDIIWWESSTVQRYDMPPIGGRVDRTVKIGERVRIHCDSKGWETFRRQMANALGLIVPEDAADPEHVAETMGNNATAPVAAEAV